MLLEENFSPRLLASTCRGPTVGFGVGAMPVIVVFMGQIIAAASAENKEVLGWAITSEIARESAKTPR